MRFTSFILFLSTIGVYSCSSNEFVETTSEEETIHKEYYENGAIKFEGAMLENSREGKHVWYYPDGTIHIVANYKNNLESGLMTEYYENGIIKYEANYNMGLVVDTAKYFYDNGKLQVNVFYKNGKVSHKNFFYPNGKLQSESYYVQVHFDPEPILNYWIEYDENGDTLNSISSYYNLINSGVAFKVGENTELEFNYVSSSLPNHRLIYGNISEDYSYNESEITIKEFKGSHVKIPANTSKAGTQTMRFIFEDYELKSDSTEQSKAIYGTYQYTVSL